MTDQSLEPGSRTAESSKRQARAHRILDAAAGLILRWGYNKTTIDDIAQQAGVAKGTIYLHWKTREELFGALIKRERLVLAEEIKQRIAADPAGGTLRGILKHTALALLKHPLMKAVLLRDLAVIGKLAQREQSQTAHLEKLLGFQTYLEFLREQQLVRTDISLPAQIYSFSAIFMGFFLVAPLMPASFTLADEELADLMAETVHRALETNRPVSAPELQNVSATFMQYLSQATAVVQADFQEEVEG